MSVKIHLDNYDVMFPQKCLFYKHLILFLYLLPLNSERFRPPTVREWMAFLWRLSVILSAKQSKKDMLEFTNGKSFNFQEAVFIVNGSKVSA